MPDRKFRTSLLTGFAITTLVLILLGVFAVTNLYQVQGKLAKEQQKADLILLTISKIETSYANQNLAWANILIFGKDPAKYHDNLAAFYESERITLQNAESLAGQLASVPELAEKSKEFLNKLYELRQNYRKALLLYNSSIDSPNSLEEFLSAITTKPTALLIEIDRGIHAYHLDATKYLQTSANQYEINFAILTIAAIAILLVGLLWFLDKYFARPMSQSIRTARLVAQGDHSQRIDAFAQGEFGELARTFNQMLDNLERSNFELENTVTKLEEQVTHRKQAESRLLEESRHLAASNKELESFSYSVSHDLRAPLRSISGFANILSEDYADSIDDAGKAYLSRIQTAAKRMGEIIDDLLELAQVNRKPLQVSEVNLSGIAEEIIQELRTAHPDREVRVEISPGLNAKADPNLARIVLVNLLGNAWKYTGDTRPASIELGQVNADEKNIYYVRDNGAGFDMAFSEKLFQPFQRLHGSEKFEGTGIGLAIVERILARHGGHIRAEAQPGEGATFEFSFGNT